MKIICQFRTAAGNSVEIRLVGRRLELGERQQVTISGDYVTYSDFMMIAEEAATPRGYALMLGMFASVIETHAASGECYDDVAAARKNGGIAK